ncbi:hypothetical protein niasHT_024979 [Heterodera trifolii]|uniref:Uncharacterized protein n=1 Tax=Heterodera trifolii TaxID=157864 RepID=A0ABD2KSI0_9BILA
MLFLFFVNAIGCVGLGLLFVKVCRSLYNILYPFVIAKPRDLHELAGGDANWAVVTGATDGIGKAYAAELALRGFNLVLISRSAHKLEAVAAELKQYSATNGQRGEVQLRTIQFDFTNANPADYERQIFGAISDLNIGILVNNVGMVNSYPERLDNSPGGFQETVDVSIVNTLPVALLSAFVLRQMASRGRGIIVNVASAAARCHWYYYGVYSAAKHFIVHLSAILRAEFAPFLCCGAGPKSANIVIQSLCPLLVSTKMASRTKGRPSLLVPSPEAYARHAIRTVGIVSDTTGHPIHQIQAELLFQCIPSPLFNWLMRNESHKRRALALAEQKSEAQNSSRREKGEGEEEEKDG